MAHQLWVVLEIGFLISIKISSITRLQVSGASEIGTFSNNAPIAIEFFNSSTPPANQHAVEATEPIENNLELPSSCKCGVLKGTVPSGKIIGGTPVGRNKFWPWFATLVHTSRPKIAHCGASLISPRWALSAAHCLLPMMHVGLRHFLVKLGYNDLDQSMNSTVDVKGVMNVGIESVLIHPKFEQSYPYHFDIGLIKLSKPVTCSHRVRPICLPSRENNRVFRNSYSAITAGFGRQGVNQNYSQTMLQIEIDVISNKECRERFSKLSYKGPRIMKNMLCAWTKGKDACVGDSGNPLFILRDNGGGGPYYEQIGITSFGVSCAHEHFPGVYTRLAKYLSWIRVNVADFNKSMLE